MVRPTAVRSRPTCLTLTTVWLRARVFRSDMLGLAVAGTGNFELRGVSGKEDRQDMVESVVRSEREDRQDVVYADSDGGANVDDAIESGRRKLGDSSATEAWLDEECTVPSSSI